MEIVDIADGTAIYDRRGDWVPVVAADGKEVASAPIDGPRLKPVLSEVEGVALTAA